MNQNERLDYLIEQFTETIDYFKNEAKSTGIPYQILINLYLADCAEKKKKIEIQWVS